MSTYNFDGIDLDWEYPVADDRGGRKEDFDNFPKFLANLKKALSATGGRDGLSITLPASYSYLQHFDIANLVKHVDFFNIMSYDLHGKWDRGNKWLDPVLNSHTNLTEITNALDLIWRNDIEPEKVVLGLAFYARVFAAADPACMDPGCIFVSGGNPGKCSDEVGILLNSEIIDIMDEQSLSATLDKEAAVQILKFDTNQWLTYDNGDTFKLKTDFARSQCLGGVMVWAVSHDLPYGNFSRVLGEAVAREVAALDLSEDKDSLEVKKTHLQCRWSNCFEDCPSGWSRIRRTDPGARTDEQMWDTTGCGGEGIHTFCCPPDSPLPKCGWYTHNNGNCDSTCPAGTVEVGSNFQHCSSNKNDYQAACCTTDTDSMKLYSQCDWAGKAPECDAGECESGQSLLASSTTGSGGNYCNVRRETFHYTLTGQEADSQERKYCCSDDSDSKWTDCQWYDDVGLAAADGWVDGFCYSGCPDDRVRVALDQLGGGCKGDGGRAKCCLAKYITLSKRAYTDAESRLRSSVKEFMDEPSCGTDDYNLKRDLAGIDFVFRDISSEAFNHSSSLRRRASSKAHEDVEELLYNLVITATATAVAQEIWKTLVVSQYPNLTVQKIRAYLNSARDWVRLGSARIVELIVCNMAIYNGKLGGQEVISCACTQSNCCDSSDPSLCGGEDLDLLTRDLDRRAPPRPFSVSLATGSVNWRSLSYRSRGEWPLSDPIWDQAYGYANDADCLDVDIGTVQVATAVGRDDYDVEHILELNTIQQFTEDASNGRMPTGVNPRNRRLPDAFIEALNTPMLLNAPPMAGGAASAVPFRRLMNALGSRRNGAEFVVLISGLNGCKSRIWRTVSPFAQDEMEDAVEADDPRQALRDIRAAITVIHYLNDPRIHPGMVAAANEVRHEYGLADEAWEAQGNAPVDAQDWWDQWIRERLRYIGAQTRTWVEHWVTQMRNQWAVRTGQQAAEVLEALGRYRSLASDMEISLEGLE